MVIVATLLASVAAAPAAAEGHGSIAAVGTDADGAAVAGTGPVLSGDGRYVAYTSEPGVSGDDSGDGRTDVVVHDRATGVTEQVTAHFDAQIDQPTSFTVDDITADGGLLALTVRYGDDGRSDVYVLDRTADEAELVSITAAGAPSGSSRNASLSATGRMVAFTSDSTAMIDGGTPEGGILVRDRARAATRLASVPPAGLPDIAHYADPRVSANGRFVAFLAQTAPAPESDSITVGILLRDLERRSTATVFFPDRPNWDVDTPFMFPFGVVGIAADGSTVAYGADERIFVYDRASQRSDFVVEAERSAFSNELQRLFSPSWAMDDRSSVIVSGAGRSEQLHRTDLDSGTTRLMTATPQGSEGDGLSAQPSVSADGTVVAFMSLATDLVPGQMTARPGVYVWEEGAPRVPSAPRTVVARPRDGGAVVSWAPPATLGGGPVERYIVTVESADGEAAAEAVSVPGTALSATVSGLTNGSAHRFGVTAANDVGEGPGSAPSTFVVPRSAPDEVERFAGSDRYATAAAAAAAHHPDGAPVVYIATGAAYPDALTGGVAAVRSQAPVLLTRPDELPAVTAAEIERLAPRGIVILGGTEAVAGSVRRQLDAVAPTTRLVGADRYATAAAIATAVFPDGADVAYVATGTDFPDALTATTLAAGDAGPVLLTDPSGLPGATEAALAALNPSRIVILGGSEAVSDAVEQELARSADVMRIAGPDRYATAAAVAAEVGPGPLAYLTTGERFPDALVAGPLAASAGAPLVLTAATSVPEPTELALGARAPEVVRILGGDAAVSGRVFDHVAMR